MLALVLLSSAAAISGSKDTPLYHGDQNNIRKVGGLRESGDDTVSLATTTAKAAAKATKFNSQLQTAAQLDAGKLRISPVGDLLGHPSAGDRERCIQNTALAKPDAKYSFNCAHKGNGDMGDADADGVDDSYDESNVIDSKSECESSYTIRHRMDDEKFGRHEDGTPKTLYAEECSLRGEVQYCAWEMDSVNCPGDQGGRDCGSKGRCMPSGETDFVCAQVDENGHEFPILVDCKTNDAEGLDADQVKIANGFGDDFTYGNPDPSDPTYGATQTGATDPERTDVHGTPN